ncbi:replication protein [Xenorhabdus innexi]|uniref:Replication protein n=1 Tax=Xenorhabdus innexi TaxID=290109 RepID=A0A1N6N1S8_9GAMM|nr:replication protein [Xenorhabdus innexi]PHM37155.1 replication protein [Xenorhabdus innexi]SIP75063.1 Replication protein 15 [Xenorhabdus innexi]
MNVVKRVDFTNKIILPEQPEVQVADLSDGYMKVANKIQQLKPRLRLSGREWQCFEAVIWLTYGWNKKQDRVTNTVLSELTGLGDTHVSDAIKSLAERKIIFSHKQGTMKLVGVNTELSEWILDKKKTGKTFPKTGKSFPNSGKVFPKTVDTQYKNNNNINNTSENSGESSGSSIQNQLSPRPDAAISTPKGDKWGTAEDLKAAEWIYEKILVARPNTKTPNWAAWANDIRLMRQADNRTHAEICHLFKWANQDSFWYCNILSPAKLREKWDTLEAQSTQPNRKPTTHATAETSGNWNTAEAWEGFL